MSDQPQSATSISESIREIIESGKDVGNGVRALVVDLLQKRSQPVEAVRNSVNEILTTTEDVVRRSAPEQADSVLRKVIDAVASGVQTVAQATNYAVQEAAARGQRFAGDDVDFAKKNLKAASEILVDTVKYAANRTASETKTAAVELKTHAERAVEAVRPTITATLDALRESPVQLASETAGTALRGGRLATGAFLSAISDVLSSAAGMLDPDHRKSAATADVTAPDQAPKP